MMLKVGKLYICEEYFLMLYPDQETAAAAIHADFAVTTAAERRGRAACGGGASASAVAAYWSKRFGKPVLFSEKNIPLLILNDKEEYVEVLAGDKKGWIIYQDWLKIKEIV